MGFNRKCTNFIFISIILQVLLLVPCNSESQEDNEVGVHEFIPPALKDILTDEVASHVVPLEIQKNFTYYLSGFDEEKRPVWIVEAGKWDFREMVEGGAEKLKRFDDFLLNAVYRFLNSTVMRSTKEDPVNEVVLLVDAEDFTLKQMASIPTTTYIIGRIRALLPAFSKLHAGYVVNVNYISQSLINLIRPILGRNFDKLEIFGNNKSKWIPQLLKHIPRDQLPEWYGGIKDFVPYQVHG